VLGVLRDQCLSPRVRVYGPHRRPVVVQSGDHHLAATWPAAIDGPECHAGAASEFTHGHVLAGWLLLQQFDRGLGDAGLDRLVTVSPRAPAFAYRFPGHQPATSLVCNCSTSCSGIPARWRASVIPPSSSSMVSMVSMDSVAAPSIGWSAPRIACAS